jgi:hypothetical protein
MSNFKALKYFLISNQRLKKIINKFNIHDKVWSKIKPQHQRNPFIRSQHQQQQIIALYFFSILLRLKTTFYKIIVHNIN